MDPSEARALLEREIGVVDDVVAWACRRHGLLGDDADSFTSYVRFRLVDDEYRMIRRFSGRASFRTYLKVLVANAYVDYRVKKWGKWRPSAVAKRMGATGVLLDTALNRDGETLEHAIERLKGRSDVPESEEELRRMAMDLPRRVQRSFTSLEDDAPVADSTAADTRLDESERERTMARAMAALDQALSKLPDQDRVMVLLHLGQGMTLASVARTLKVPQKPLYRRLHSTRERLQELLQAEGVDRSLLQDVLSL